MAALCILAQVLLWIVTQRIGAQHSVRAAPRSGEISLHLTYVQWAFPVLASGLIACLASPWLARRPFLYGIAIGVVASLLVHVVMRGVSVHAWSWGGRQSESLPISPCVVAQVHVMSWLRKAVVLSAGNAAGLWVGRLLLPPR